MSSYINSNNNRLYVVKESTYGNTPALTAANRIPAVSLAVKQRIERAERRDKTGSRTFFGLPAGLRTATQFALRTYMTAWQNQTQPPAYGPLFEAGLGAGALSFGGATVASVPGQRRLQFGSSHGLIAGQGVTFGSEMRFVEAVIDAQTVELNAPFTVQPSAGSPLGKTVTYRPATDLPSVSVLDYWSPSSSVQRVLCGAAVDKVRVLVNADFHEFEFVGMSRDVLDSSSFASGQGGMSQFPAEPAITALSMPVVPGHLGQVWMGTGPNQLLTLTDAKVEISNNVDLRNREFGSSGPQGIVAGQREVSLDFSVFERDDDATKALYQAARTRSPIQVMFQLGQQSGQLVGIYLKGLVPEVPQFDDSETRLQWKFNGCRAQGTVDDEVSIAFG